MLWEYITIRPKALKKGHFSYTDRYHTHAFIDTDLLFQYPKIVGEVVENIYNCFSSFTINYVITPNFRSGAILSHNIAEKFNANVILLRRKRGEVTIPPDLELSGNGLIIDDGISTGETLKKLLKIEVKTDINIIGIGVVLDRYIKDPAKEFSPAIFKSVLSLRESPFKLIDTYEEINKCPQCNRTIEISRLLKKEEDFVKKDVLKKELKLLKLKSAYGDVD